MLKQIILLTGQSGIGKTSILHRTINKLKKRGHIVGGVVCRGVREGGMRVGFEIMDLSSGQRGWLAHINQSTGPKIGRYTVNLTDIGVLGAGSIFDAVQNADVLVVDEIGPMELLSTTFSNALIQAIESGKPLLGTIPYNLCNSLVESIKTREDTEVIEVTSENRENLPTQVVNKICEYLI